MFVFLEIETNTNNIFFSENPQSPAKFCVKNALNENIKLRFTKRRSVSKNKNEKLFFFTSFPRVFMPNKD